MKILILVDKFNGGAGNIAQIISSELSNRQNEVTLVLTDDPEKKSKHKHLLSGVRLVYLPKPYNPQSFYMGQHILKLIQQVCVPLRFHRSEYALL